MKLLIALIFVFGSSRAFSNERFGIDESVDSCPKKEVLAKQGTVKNWGFDVLDQTKAEANRDCKQVLDQDRRIGRCQVDCQSDLLDVVCDWKFYLAQIPTPAFEIKQETFTPAATYQGRPLDCNDGSYWVVGPGEEKYFASICKIQEGNAGQGQHVLEVYDSLKSAPFLTVDIESDELNIAAPYYLHRVARTGDVFYATDDGTFLFSKTSSLLASTRESIPYRVVDSVWNTYPNGEGVMAMDSKGEVRFFPDETVTPQAISLFDSAKVPVWGPMTGQGVVVPGFKNDEFVVVLPDNSIAVVTAKGIQRKQMPFPQPEVQDVCASNPAYYSIRPLVEHADEKILYVSNTDAGNFGFLKIDSDYNMTFLPRSAIDPTWQCASDAGGADSISWMVGKDLAIKNFFLLDSVTNANALHQYHLNSYTLDPFLNIAQIDRIDLPELTKGPEFTLLSSGNFATCSTSDDYQTTFRLYGMKGLLKEATFADNYPCANGLVPDLNDGLLFHEPHFDSSEFVRIRFGRNGCDYHDVYK